MRQRLELSVTTCRRSRSPRWRAIWALLIAGGAFLLAYTLRIDLVEMTGRDTLLPRLLRGALRAESWNDPASAGSMVLKACRGAAGLRSVIAHPFVGVLIGEIRECNPLRFPPLLQPRQPRPSLRAINVIPATPPSSYISLRWMARR